MPATLIGRLAVDRRYQGHGLGRLLLMDALERNYSVTPQVASLAVVVEAKDDAARAFYERFGFQRFLDREHRLYLPMTTVAQLVQGD